MKVRLGYVALALALEKTTTSSTLTYARYSKMTSPEKQLNELKRVTYSNIEALEKIILYNIEKGIEFYRITSKLIPLATHPEVLWDFKKYFGVDYKLVGDLIKKYNLRVDTHPDQFDVINSLREDVVINTKRDFRLHEDIFTMMGLDERYAKMVIHVGSSQGGKEVAKQRFIDNYWTIEERTRKRIILENDDKVFNLQDVIDIYRETGVPIVLDIHHHRCNPTEQPIEELLPTVISSWKQERWVPKVHLSSPIEGAKDQRKHADYIDVVDLINLVELFKGFDQDVDIMLECKKKDLALYQLVDDIKEAKPEWEWLSPSVFTL